MDINDGGAEDVLAVDVCDGCSKSGLDHRQAGEVGDRAGVVREGVGGEDLSWS